eukprot:Phypoly_transcript_00595.p1 GENE.Phypoly_transcript_00595~~Phypoly_transcript_00595.p1  ORF type:complete len:1399 (+),score=296.34 Phypoly_transcript_00595:319-4197(+)
MDPLSRCAAVLFYDRQFAIIPFHDEPSSILDDEPRSVASGDTPSFVIHLHDLNIHNVKDFVFLEGYYEPTVLILHEPRPTWVGRIAVRKETCVVTALSLNISQKLHPVIWTVDHLPSTAAQLVAVPEPLGGALVLCTNHLLYFNQSVKYGMVLNEYGKKEMGTFPLDEAKPVIALDNAVCSFISENCVLISLKTGELYLSHLVSDGRYLRSMHLAKAGASVLPTCMCRLSTDLICLGSRLGDSLIIKFTQKTEAKSGQTENGNPDDAGEPPEKRLKLSQEREKEQDKDKEGLIENEERSMDFLEEGEYVEESAIAAASVPQYTFAVWESILNIGPVSDSIVGESQDPASNSHQDTDNHKRQLELVTCSGHGKNGSIVVLQRTIRPDLVTAFELPGCRGVWTVYSDVKEEKDDSEMADVDVDSPNSASNSNSNSNANSPNSNSNSNSGKRSRSKSPEKEGEEPSENGTPSNHIKSEETPGEEAEREAPKEKVDLSQFHSYLVISRDDSTMILSTGEELSEITDRVDFYVKGRTILVGNVRGHHRIVQVCPKAVRLLAGVRCLQDYPFHRAIVYASLLDPFILIKLDNGTIQLLEATDDLLVPKEIPILAPFTSQAAPQISSASLFRDNPVNPYFGTTPSQNYIIVAFSDGTMCIYRLPDFSLIFHYPTFGASHCVLSHHDPALVTSQKLTAPAQPDPSIVEVAVVFTGGQGHQYTPPHIIAILDNNDLLIYRGFVSDNTKQGIPLRFAKIDHGLITRVLPDEAAPLGNFQRIFKFDNIEERSGVFIAGASPVWVFLERTTARVHPMDLDGFVPCFTPFHNLKCTRGFIYCGLKGVLKICQLAAHITYSSYWPYRKVPVRLTPHRIAYHSETKTYVVGMSQYVPDNTDPVTSSDTQMGVPSPEEPPPLVNGAINNPKVPPPMMDRFELRVYSPVTWESQDKYQLDPHEHILALRVVLLRSDEGGNKAYIAVGTGYAQGEDMACRGRILVFEVMREHPPRIELLSQEEQDQQEDRIFFRLAGQKEQKGQPITALAALEGYLMTATGPKIIVYNFHNGKDLIGAAFFDAQIFIVSINTVKNWIIVGDAYKSVYFIRWKEDGKSLTLLAKDFQHLNIYATEYLIEQQTLGITVTDASKNLMLFSYTPQSPESRSGQMLLCRADFHVGSHINKLVRIPVLPPGPQPRHALVFGTLDGAIGYLRPLEEATFKKLAALQSKLMTAIPHAAGLNPRAFRLAKFGRRAMRVHQKHILDGELIWKYVTLDRPKMREIGLAIGADPDALVTTIKELDQATCAAC